mgnify:CR=1 FL=1
MQQSMQYNVNGHMVPASSATLAVNDLAILRGYGIFDYFLFQHFQPLYIDEYLQRFFRSAELMHLAIPMSQTELHRAILQLIAANQAERGGIRLVLTGGYAPDGYTPVAPNLIIMQHPWPTHPEYCYTDGVKLLTAPFSREIPEVKTINYMMGIRMLPKLKEAGAKEVLYHTGDSITESTRSNFFLLKNDGTLVTQSEDILLGITRRQVLDLAAPLTKVEVRDLKLDELCDAREAFLTGSTKKIMPVVQINALQIGEGRPGEFTRHLMQAFAERSKAYAKNAGQTAG